MNHCHLVLLLEIGFDGPFGLHAFTKQNPKNVMPVSKESILRPSSREQEVSYNHQLVEELA